jgi:non-ribosomal peptide synthase protein (TIGR01720 family)
VTDEAFNGLEIAIIGTSGRFPGATSVRQFWANLCDGVESIVTLSDEQLLAAGADPEQLSDPSYVKRCAVLDNVERFDAAFFGYTPREVEIMDPQQRFLLMAAWEALEDAGYAPENYAGKIAVYASGGMNTYLLSNLHSNQVLWNALGGLHIMIENSNDFLATHVSYKLGLRGPSITVQTACSSSLVGVHLACRSLLSGECDMALAGGSSILIPHDVGYVYEEGAIFSPDGHCRAFDARAGGTVTGNGAAMVVLKRLEDALADRDTIYAVIKGSAVNNDGTQKIGYTAPSIEGQTEVITMAQKMAEVDPETIGYIEAHGTGTKLGDPIEVAALTEAFRQSTARKQFCAIGSVKTNVGHLDAASGAAGLIKAALALKYGQIPPSLNFETPNPKIRFDDSPFYVQTRLTRWPAGHEIRRAGVSSFGVGGTNAHVILEEPPPVATGPATRPWQLLTLSARTSTALDTATANLAAHLDQQPDLNLADVAYTLQVGRRAFNQRRFLVCRSTADAAAALKSGDPQRLIDGAQTLPDRPVVFLFPGQGAQYVNMGRDLYETEQVFREELDRCAELLRPLLGQDIRGVLFPPTDQEAAATQALQQTALCQPILFVIEYALAKLWMSRGIRPQVMIGHSIGEYVAACLAGVFSLADALALVANRGALMQSMPPGVMLVVALPERQLTPLLGASLALAAVNEPGRCVVAGPEAAIAALEQTLAGQEIACRRLHTSHAFHSAMMTPILEPFAAQVRRVQLKAPQIPYLSNVTGTWITAAEATDPGYWARHLRQTVQFAAGLSELFSDPTRVLLEVGPGTTLSTFVKQHPDKPDTLAVLPSLRHPRDSASDEVFLLHTLGKLWLAGVTIDWNAPYGDLRPQRVSLPTYPFELQRYWVAPQPFQQQRNDDEPLKRKADLADWFYLPSWKRSLPPAADPTELHAVEGCWLIFADACGLGEAIRQQLQRAGQQAILASPGAAFARLADQSYTIDPARRADYDALLSDLQRAHQPPTHIVHLGHVTDPDHGFSIDEAHDAQGFYSLLFLAQALAEQADPPSIKMAIISNQLHAVSASDPINPTKALLLGPSRVIPQELAHITCRSIDIVLPRAEPAEQLADRVIAELLADTTDAVLAYRGYDRWVQSFEPARLEPFKGALKRLRQHGVYLITGGLGGVGLELANYLAMSVEARLVLIGRSTFPPREAWDDWLLSHPEDAPVSQTIRRLRTIEALGAEVLILSADVADEAQVQAVVAQVRERFGALHGIIHSAGVPGGGLIRLKTPEAAAAVLAPKFEGTLALARGFADVPLDFFALCSSVVSVSSLLGRVDYCAANAFLDAFAAYYTATTGTFTFAINWDTWHGIGMANTSTPRGLAQRSSQHTELRVAHPLLDSYRPEGSSTHGYRTSFSIQRHWVLSEHRILGSAAVPGTTYLELARAALTNVMPHEVVELQDVVFLTPLLVGEHEQREVQTILEQHGETFTFRVVSSTTLDNGSVAWQEHVRGMIGPGQPAATSRYDLDAIKGRCRPVAAQHSAQELAELGVALGPRWQNTRQVYLGRAEGLAELELPAAFVADLETYHVHPALLDEATSFASQLATEGMFLPLSYGRLTLRAPLPGKLYSYAQFQGAPDVRGETVTADIVLLDAEGHVLAEVESFTMKRVTQEASNRITGRSDEAGAPDSAIPAAPPASTAVVAAEQRQSHGPDLFQVGDSEALLPHEGVEAFHRILARSSLPQVIVFTRDLPQWIEQARALTQSEVLEGIGKAPAASSRHSRPALESAYVAPQNEVERVLAEIWEELLGIDSIGVYDNFFELGGDSLISIQILTKAKQRGYRLAPQDVFEHPTIAALAAMVQRSQVAIAVQGLVEGQVPLTPMQAWFFEHALPEPHHWNQSLFVELPTTIAPTLLEQSLEHVLRHHDALRLRFQPTEAGWQQTNAGMDSAVPFAQIDLSTLSSAEQSAALASAEAELHSSLSLTNGPLLRALLVNRGAGTPLLLLLIVHHLAVDLDSWRILLADLQTACEQLRRGQPVALPPKTTSFKDWAERLVRYAETSGARQQAGYWLDALDTPNRPLPVDTAAGMSANTEASQQRVQVWLSVEETDQLLHDVPKAYRVQTNEVLLTALSQTIARWIDSDTLLVDLEANGRDVAIEDADLTRTVGWFTILYPMRLKLPNPHDLDDSLRSVKEQLRSVPEHGVGYGLARYVGQDAASAALLKRMPQPQINFLYLGQLDQQLAGGLFQSISSSRGPEHSPRGQRTHLLEVNASIVGDRLQLEWMYSDRIHHHATIERLAQSHLQDVRRIVTHCLTSESVGYTLSDFQAAGLNQQELDSILSEFADIVEDD